MNRKTIAQDLAATVDRLVEALETLGSDLAVEREALSQRCSPEELEHVALRKSTAVEHVSNLYNGLREALALGHDGQDVGNALADLGKHEPALASRVERLLELTRACQLANQENGAMIGAAMRNSERALETLRELGANESETTYSASGQTRQHTPARQGLTVRA